MTKHPILIYYKNTLKTKNSLILFIGREPNDNNDIINKIGEYDFDIYSRCAFWNTAYGVVGNFCNLTTKEIKNKTREQGYSEIIFADSLPTTIKNKVKDKSELRNFSDEFIINHVKNISKLEIFKRVNMIVLCGLSHKSFRTSVNEFKKIATEKGIKIIETKFLIGNNKKKIIKDLQTENFNKYYKNKIKYIVKNKIHLEKLATLS